MGVPSSLPIQTRIRQAAEYALRNRIKKGGALVRYSDAGNGTVRADGYYTTIGEVRNRPTPPSSYNQYPGISVFIENETCADTGNTQIEQNTSLLSESLTLTLECYIQDCNDPQLACEKLLADLKTYFGTNYFIPDSAGAATCLTCYYDSSATGMINDPKPMAYLIAKFRVWYRERINDPTRSS